MAIGSFAAFCGIVLLASIVQGVSGFAFSMVVLMVFPYIFGYTKSLVLAALLAMLIDFFNAFVYRKYVEWRWVPKWMAVFLVADLASVLVLKRVGEDPIWYTLMGIIFIVMSVYLLWGQRVIHVQAGNRAMVILAALSGLVMGAFGVGGPLMAAFFLEATDDKEHYLGTSQFVAGLTLGVDFLMRVLNGMFTTDIIGYSALSLVFMIIGLFIARSLVRHMDALTLRKFICIVMILNGIVMLFH
ncbi:MAG: sulfite exporter TauE/SafE family protein [Peptococcaceae bacterium]|nr:sulfite exporter TauE/SafE family protein [Peptococcaceae bacterium]